MVDHHFPFRNWVSTGPAPTFPGTRHWVAVQPPNRATMKAWWHRDRSESGDRSIQGQFGLCLGIETNLNYGFSWFKQPKSGLNQPKWDWKARNMWIELSRMGTNEPTSGNLGNLWFAWPLILKLAKPPVHQSKTHVERLFTFSSPIEVHHLMSPLQGSLSGSQPSEFPLNQLVCWRVTYRSVDNRNLHIFLVDLTFIFPRYCRSTCRSAYPAYPPVHGKLGNLRKNHRSAAQLPLEAGSWNRCCWFEARSGET